MTRHRSQKGGGRAARLSRRLKLASASEVKRQVFYALENAARGNLVAKVAGYSLFALILGNAAIVFVSAQPGLDPVAIGVITRFYTFSTVCFAVEYAARIWIADLAYDDVAPWRARLRYVTSPLGIIDLLSFGPNVLAWFVPLTPSLHDAINVLRLVRLIKISRYMRGLRTIGRVLSKRRHEIVASFLVIALLVVVSSILMYEIESPVQPDAFNSLLTGLYWAVETVTGTGYGDIVPVTVPGRMVGSLIMFLSVALVAIPGGIFSAGFVAEFQNASLRKLERDERRSRRDDEQERDDEGDDDGDDAEAKEACENDEDDEGAHGASKAREARKAKGADAAARRSGARAHGAQDDGAGGRDA